MSRTKSLATILLTSSIVLSTGAVLAQSPMEKVFYSATTSAQSFETQKRKGFAGGSASYRMRYITDNFVAFRPPSLSVGCTGIDAHMGAFSFIQDLAGELQNAMRQIAAGAASYAFNLALSTLCSTCQAHLQKLKSTLNQWNQFFKDSCSLGENIMSAALTPAEKEKSGLQSIGLSNAAGGIVDGFADFTQSVIGQDFTQAANGSSGGVSAFEGNLLIKAFEETGMDNWTITFQNTTGVNQWTYQELLMSLVGTYISESDSASNPDSSKSNMKYTYIKPPLTLEELLFAKEVDANNAEISISILKCDPNPGCKAPAAKPFNNWKPLKQMILDIMVPSNSPDMLERYVSKADFTNDQIDLIKSNPNNLYNLLVGMGALGYTDLKGDRNWGEMIAEDAAIKMGQKMMSDMNKMMFTLENSDYGKSDQEHRTFFTTAREEIIRSREELEKQTKDNQTSDFQSALFYAKEHKRLLNGVY